MGSDARFQVRLITPGSIAHASPGRSPRGCQRAPQRIRSTREQVTFGVTGRRKSRRVSLTASCDPSFLYLGVTWDQRHGSWTFWPRSSCPTSYLLGSQGRNPRHKGQGLPPAIRLVLMQGHTHMHGHGWVWCEAIAKGNRASSVFTCELNHTTQIINGHMCYAP
jgi:hypothetical protein